MLLRLLERAATLVSAALARRGGVHEPRMGRAERVSDAPVTPIVIAPGLVSVPLSPCATDFLQEILLGWVDASPELDASPACECGYCRAYVQEVMHAMLRHAGDELHSPVITSLALGHLALLARHDFDAEEAAAEASNLVNAMAHDELRAGWKAFKQRRAHGAAKRSVM